MQWMELKGQRERKENEGRRWEEKRERMKSGNGRHTDLEEKRPENNV